MTKPSFGGGSIARVQEPDFGGDIRAVSCATVNQFVVIAESENGSANDGPFSVRWCAIGDATDWPAPATDDARAKQAGRQQMDPTHGEVTAISGGDFFGYVFQERAITKMTYIGGDVVFTFDTFEEGRGCWEYNRRASVDDMVFFESESGYHVVQEGVVSDIGIGRVDESRRPTKVAAGVAGTYNQQNVVVNKLLNLVFFQSQSLCYNYKTDQWTELVGLSSFNYVAIDSFAGIVGHSSAPATGGVLFDQDGGSDLTATLLTTDYRPNAFGRSYVDGVKPLVTSGGTITTLVNSRSDLDDSADVATGSSVNTFTGYSHFSESATYPSGELISVSLDVAGGFDTVIGVDVEYHELSRA